jgi:hypothetical protein
MDKCDTTCAARLSQGLAEGPSCGEKDLDMWTASAARPENISFYFCSSALNLDVQGQAVDSVKTKDRRVPGCWAKGPISRNRPPIHPTFCQSLTQERITALFFSNVQQIFTPHPHYTLTRAASRVLCVISAPGASLAFPALK